MTKLCIETLTEKIEWLKARVAELEAALGQRKEANALKLPKFSGNYSLDQQEKKRSRRRKKKSPEKMRTTRRRNRPRGMRIHSQNWELPSAASTETHRSRCPDQALGKALGSRGIRRRIH